MTEITITLLGLLTVVGVKVMAQLENVPKLVSKIPAVKDIDLVPVAEVSRPILPQNPDMLIAGVGLVTAPIVTTTFCTNTLDMLAKAPKKLTEVAVDPQVKLVTGTPSTTMELQVTCAVFIV